MTDEPKTFEIGLVMAGAVSAGAYTAGVLDFLLEALERWHEEKDQQRAQHGENYAAWTVPPHKVQISVVAGASAGSICAGLLTAVLGNTLTHVHVGGDDAPDETEVAGNLLYRSWVRDIDLSWLLDTGDIAALEKGEPLPSLLNCQRIDDVACDVARAGKTGTPSLPPHIADGMPVVLSVGNLRGVPYEIGFSGDAGTSHGMSRHADFVRFDLAVNAEPHASAVRLVPGEGSADPDIPNVWDEFANVALASSAFPVALKPRRVSATHARINARPWIGAEPVPDGEPGQFRYRTGPIRSRLADDAGPHEFVTVDGGLLDNEPFEIARQLLAGNDYRNPREKHTAKRAILMIDPFPNGDSYDPDYDAVKQTGLLKVVLGMFAALKNNARFKADTLSLVGNETQSYSRFVISPSGARIPDPPPPAPVDIACGALGGFSGFFAQTFRHHDFVLGRRNCQRFLGEYFMVGEANPLFGAAGGAWRQDARWRRGDPAGDGMLHPVVPLVDELYSGAGAPASAGIEPASWPRLSEGQWLNIEYDIRHRMAKVSKRLLQENFGGFWGGAASLGLDLFGGKLKARAVDTIIGHLVAAGLLDPRAADPAAPAPPSDITA